MSIQQEKKCYFKYGSTHQNSKNEVFILAVAQDDLKRSYKLQNQINNKLDMLLETTMLPDRLASQVVQGGIQIRIARQNCFLNYCQIGTSANNKPVILVYAVTEQLDATKRGKKIIQERQNRIDLARNDFAQKPVQLVSQNKKQPRAFRQQRTYQ